MNVAAQGNWWPALDFFTGHRLPILIQYRRRALYVFVALLSPVRVYKPLGVHLLSILIEIRVSLLSGSCSSPSSSEFARTRLYSPASSR
jgi:hypothetical protein